LCHWCMRDKCYEAGHNYSWNPDSIKSDGKTTHYGSFSCIECGYENMPTYFNHKYDDNDVCIVCYYKHEHDFSNGGICECGEQTNRCLVCNTEQTNLYSGYCNSCKADECEAKGHQQYWRNIFKCENTHKGVVQCAEESNNCGYYWVNKEFNHRIVNGICNVCGYEKK